MKLKQIPFDLIKEGKKTIEVRLYDEKRQKIKPLDTITFTNDSNVDDKLTVMVTALFIYPTFEMLFTNFPAKDFGAEGWSVQAQVENMHLYYSANEEAENSVVGIQIRIKST